MLTYETAHSRYLYKLIMNLQPRLENKALLIRPLKESDFESLYDVAKDPKIWEQHPRKRNVRTEFEQFFSESIKSKGALVIIDKKTDTIIGSSRYKIFDEVPNILEIGWTFLDRTYWGGEYNGMVKNLMTQYAFDFVTEIHL